MTNPTSNYGWQMPTATDLVTDLPADFEVFGQAVDTALADLLGGTTGQVLSKTSATSMDFTWVTPGAGDVTGVTAGTGITVTDPTGPVPTVTNSMATAFTTSGDLIQATGSGTFARLGTGTSGQYLTTNGTTNSWGTVSAGGMTVIASGSLTSTSVSITSIPGTYKDLQLRIFNFEATIGSNMQIRINNDSAANKYAQNTASTDARERAYNQTNSAIAFNTDNAVNNGLVTLTIPNYANTTTSTIGFAYAMLNSGNNSATINTTYNIMVYKEVDAVTSLQMVFDGGTASAGTYILYGVS